MIEDIRRHLAVSPFVPFRVRTTDGHEYPVPTLDHIYLSPSGGVVISDDKAIVVLIPSLHISGLLHSVVE